MASRLGRHIGVALVGAVFGGCATQLGGGAQFPTVDELTAVAGSTRKICQLTGDSEPGLGGRRPVKSRSGSRADLLGTDLGASFSGPAPGTIHFLFGDSVAGNEGAHAPDDDAVAYTPADADPEQCLELVFYSDARHEYVPVRLAGSALGSFEVPTGGFVVAGTTFVTFATEARGNPRRPTRSVLAVDERFPQEMSFLQVANLPASKLLNVSTVLVDDRWRPSRHPTQALFFGTGAYRSSRNVYLAVFPLNKIRSGGHVWFVKRAGSGEATWSAAEKRARPVFDRDGTACMGELSVGWNVYLNRWLMLYDCSQPRGIVYRVATEPWGPWSEPRVLFDPRRDHGYCEFMHDREPAQHCPPGSPNPQDQLIARSGGDDAYGGEYGPYVIDAFTRGNREDRSTTIYFTMSTWNPYEVVLMRAQLREGGRRVSTR